MPGMLHSMKSQKVGYGLATEHKNMQFEWCWKSVLSLNTKGRGQRNKNLDKPFKNKLQKFISHSSGGWKSKARIQG